MIDIEVPALHMVGANMMEIGHWLDEVMPNPPLTEPQRWTVGYSNNGIRVGIRFLNDADATLFKLRWGSENC